MVILLIAQFYVPIIGSIVVLTFVSTSSAIVTTFKSGLVGGNIIANGSGVAKSGVTIGMVVPTLPVVHGVHCWHLIRLWNYELLKNDQWVWTKKLLCLQEFQCKPHDNI
jgi:hypothetical protein